MKRETLKNLGLEDEIIDEIMKEHGKTVARKDARISTLEEERDSLTEDIQSRDNQIKSLKDNPQLNDETKKKLSDYENENKKLKDERKNILVDSAIKVAVAKKAHNPDTVARLLNRDGLEVEEDGSIKGLEEKLTALETSDPYLFITDNVETAPADKSESESEKKDTSFNPGNNRSNDGKETTPEEIGKAAVDRLFGKKE